MPVLTKSQINRMPISQRRRREADIVYKACYHEAQRQGLWHKHASVQSVNFKAQVLPALAKPIIEKYKSLGKVSSDFTVEVFSNVINGEPQDKTVNERFTRGGINDPQGYGRPMPTKATTPLALKAVSQQRSGIDGQADHVESLKGQIQAAELNLSDLQSQLATAEAELQAAIDSLTARYRKPMPVETVELALPGLEMPSDQPVKAKRSKRSTKRK